MVCPIITTREKLYSGGYAADSEESNDGQVTIDGVDYYFNDAPMIVGFEAFRGAREMMRQNVKRGGEENEEEKVDFDEFIQENIKKVSEDDERVYDLRVLDTLHELEVRESMKELVYKGAADIPTKDELAKKYTGSLIERERKMLDRVKELAAKK